MARKKVARATKSNICNCCSGYGHKKMSIGFVLLLISAMLYLEYGWMEIFGLLGILAILKGLLVSMKK
ncbi:MAG: hypothetical protein KJ906_03910 [Nanoarchaeota archaeon]|nr:hypothetical protein [Nanoarchaeota archaeon]